jgi:hypothetical protein
LLTVDARLRIFILLRSWFRHGWLGVKMVHWLAGDWLSLALVGIP